MGNCTFSSRGRPCGFRLDTLAEIFLCINRALGFSLSSPPFRMTYEELSKQLWGDSQGSHSSFKQQRIERSQSETYCQEICFALALFQESGFCLGWVAFNLRSGDRNQIVKLTKFNHKGAMVIHLKTLAKNVWFMTTMVIQHIFSDFLHVEHVLKFLSVESHSPFPRVACLEMEFWAVV